MKNWKLRLVMSLVELVAAVVIWVWIGWEGVLVYCVGAVLIGIDRDIVEKAEARRRVY